jgi:5-methylcytosine-specific restriction endonuclease McrA
VNASPSRRKSVDADLLTQVQLTMSWRFLVLRDELKIMSLRMHNFGGSYRPHLPPSMLPGGVHQENDGHALHQPVLVLNASYEPINVCAARRAIVLVLKGIAMTEEENGHFLHAARVAMRVPSVIRLLEYRRIPHQSRALSRKNILLRDHVIPRSRGGLSTWENLVACCHPCNRRKGNQLPHESNMRPMREPRSFNLHTSRHIMRLMGHSDDKWRKYLFY